MVRALLAMAAGLASLGAAPAPRAPAAAPVRFAWFDYAGTDAAADRPGPGRYANPILAGFYPDPSVIRVGKVFYLVNSSFAYFPGLPVFRSRDLVHWTQVGNAIDRPGQLDFTGHGLSRGVFAPSLLHRDGRFYIVNTCVDCGGTFIVSARDPAGPWSDPVWIRDVGGIDPSLFVDDDGTAWLLNNDAPPGPPRYEGHRAIWIRRFDLAAMRTAGPAKPIVDGGVDIATKPAWAEGPHLLRHDGRYYLITAEGGTAADHAEVAYRADRPDGPFVADPRPILTQRDLDPARADPVTSAGHAQLVDTPAGDWWATFLATRPYRGGAYNTGRETFLLPVAWREGWPVILPPTTPVPRVAAAPLLPPDRAPVPLTGSFALHETFAGPRLPPAWMTVRNPATRWWRPVRGGGIDIVPRPDRIGEAGQPSYLARRLQHRDASVTTRIMAGGVGGMPGGKAGLVAYQDEAHYYFVGIVDAAGRRLVRVERRAGAGDPVDGVVLAQAPLPPRGDVRLRVTIRGALCDFAFAAGDGAWRPLLADADATVLSTQRAGGFVGATVGLYAHAPR